MTSDLAREPTDDGSTDAEETDSGSEDGNGADRDWTGFARTWGSRLGVVVLLLVVIPFVVYAIPQVAGADQSYVVLSPSMEPAIDTGDVVLVEHVDPTTIENGDVITFKRGSEETPKTHRVVEVLQEDGQPAFKTKGDNNDAVDAFTVTGDQVVGKVVFPGGVLLSIPLVGWVISYAGSPIGFVALFVLPVTLLILNEVWNVVSASSTTSSASGETSGADARAGANAAAVSDGTGSPEIGTSSAGEIDDETDDGQVTFTASELELGLFVLVAFAAYSIWVAYATTEIWSFGVAGSVLVALLLLGGLYLNGKRGTAEDASQVQESPSRPDGGDAYGDPVIPDMSAGREADDD